MAIDLVCHMEIDENNPETPFLEYKGVMYYFCTPLCQAQFEAEPERFIDEERLKQINRLHKGRGNIEEKQWPES